MRSSDQVRIRFISQLINFLAEKRGGEGGSVNEPPIINKYGSRNGKDARIFAVKILGKSGYMHKIFTHFQQFSKEFSIQSPI